LRQSDVPGLSQAASIRLGGITLYGQSKGELDQAIERGAAAICKTSGEHLLITRDLLRRAAAEQCDILEEQRIFSALLGLCLRRGVLDTLVCTAHTGSQYWTIFNGNRGNEIDNALEWACSRARARGEVRIKDLRDHFFPDHAWGTWASAQNILCRAVTLGLVWQVDKYSFELASELKDAVRNRRIDFAAFHLGRMDLRE
jgi:hypothetical protein